MTMTLNCRWFQTKSDNVSRTKLQIKIDRHKNERMNEWINKRINKNILKKNTILNATYGDLGLYYLAMIHTEMLVPTIWLCYMLRKEMLVLVQFRNAEHEDKVPYNLAMSRMEILTMLCMGTWVPSATYNLSMFRRER